MGGSYASSYGKFEIEKKNNQNLQHLYTTFHVTLFSHLEGEGSDLSLKIKVAKKHCEIVIRSLRQFVIKYDL